MKLGLLKHKHFKFLVAINVFGEVDIRLGDEIASLGASDEF